MPEPAPFVANEVVSHTKLNARFDAKVDASALPALVGELAEAVPIEAATQAGTAAALAALATALPGIRFRYVNGVLEFFAEAAGAWVPVIGSSIEYLVPAGALGFADGSYLSLDGVSLFTL